MLVYGEGGVGKTTFGATAPKPLLADCENGAKYFGLRGIEMNVARITKWEDMKDFLLEGMKPEYETLIIDPIGELMDKLKRRMVALGDKKLVQADGSPTMAGWGWLKKTMRDYLKALRDTGKNILIVAHIEEKEDEGRIIKRPKIETRLSDDLVNMVDVVGYMTVINDGEKDKRIIIVDASSDKYTAKDRSGQLGKVILPDFKQIMSKTQGEDYKWEEPKKEPEQKEGPSESVEEAKVEEVKKKSKPKKE